MQDPEFLEKAAKAQNHNLYTAKRFYSKRRISQKLELNRGFLSALGSTWIMPRMPKQQIENLWTEVANPLPEENSHEEHYRGPKNWLSQSEREHLAKLIRRQHRGYTLPKDVLKRVCLNDPVLKEFVDHLKKEIISVRTERMVNPLRIIQDSFRAFHRGKLQSGQQNSRYWRFPNLRY